MCASACSRPQRTEIQSSTQSCSLEGWRGIRKHTLFQTFPRVMIHSEEAFLKGPELSPFFLLSLPPCSCFSLYLSPSIPLSLSPPLSLSIRCFPNVTTRLWLTAPARLCVHPSRRFHPQCAEMSCADHEMEQTGRPQNVQNHAAFNP